ncbi:MAG: hypothetical protein IKC27_09075 [Kiritimatiellae bacterium]|nr:hypothetical protein [Kiritimatiellia bacterium]
MQRYTKVDANGLTHILSDVVVDPQLGRTYSEGTAEYIAYAEQNGFTLSDVSDNSLPTAEEIDAMTRGEKDEVLKKLVNRV